MQTGTLMDIRNQLDSQGLPARVIEVMNTSGHLTADAIWKESNSFGKHTTPRRSSLPTGEFRRVNRGVAPSKGSIRPEVDYVGYIESVSMIDDRTIRGAAKGSKQQLRADYDAAHGLGLAKTGRMYSIYGDRQDDPDAYNGMATKRATLGEHCIDCAPDSPGENLTSLYFCLWDEGLGCHNIYPKDSAVGIETEDFGKQVIQDPWNTDVVRFLPMWMTWFYYDLGFVVADDRGLIRLANIDTDQEDAAYFQSVFNKMQLALRLMTTSPDSGKVMIYGNNKMMSFLDNMETALQTVQWRPVEHRDLKYMQSFRGAPLRICEEILDNEEQVIAAS